MEPKKPYILFADDDEDDQEMLMAGVSERDLGLNFVCVSDGQKLLDHLNECSGSSLPALILMDYKMPVFTAKDILIALSKVAPYARIPKLVWSTSYRNEYVQVCLDNGALRYFEKPNRVEDLRKIVDQIELAVRLSLL